ncbi:hypothetical protein FP803_00055 [Candidatus Woesearchaeota archaeon]|nr:hypothetical protein [Candidatus Woesearchaeota archaeon]
MEDMINEIVTKAFNIFKKQYVALILGTLVALLGMVFIITIPPFVFGIYFMCINAVKGKKVQISDVFNGFDYFFTSWGLFIVAFLAISVGFALLVIPGLLLMVLFQYAAAFAILEKKGAISSLERSYEIAKKNFAFSVVLLILIAVINSVGGLTRIGVLITFPFTLLCICLAADKLTTKKK